MRKYTHYGKEVIYQQLVDESVRAILKKNGIKYTDLPILENDVLMYEKDGKTKYVCIVTGYDPEAYVENTYMTTDIPVDMDWHKLVLDCQRQKDGNEPMRIKTKASLICEKAEEMVMNEAMEKSENIFDILKLDPKEFRHALLILGYNLEDIKKMDHSDINEDFLNEMSK